MEFQGYRGGNREEGPREVVTMAGLLQIQEKAACISWLLL